MGNRLCPGKALDPYQDFLLQKQIWTLFFFLNCILILAAFLYLLQMLGCHSSQVLYLSFCEHHLTQCITSHAQIMCLSIFSLSALVWLQLFDYCAIFGWTFVLDKQANRPRAVQQLCGHLQAERHLYRVTWHWWLVWFSLNTRNQLVIYVFNVFEAESLHVIAFFFLSSHLTYRLIRVSEFE